MTQVNTTERLYTVTVPSKFADWFEGTNLVTGGDDHDPACKTLRIAWYWRSEKRDDDDNLCYEVTGNKTAMLLLKEYGGYCWHANGDADPAEAEAGQTVINGVTEALSDKEADKEA